jgi:hypothetical protein
VNEFEGCGRGWSREDDWRSRGWEALGLFESLRLERRDNKPCWISIDRLSLGCTTFSMVSLVENKYLSQLDECAV